MMHEDIQEKMEKLKNSVVMVSHLVDEPKAHLWLNQMNLGIFIH